MIDRTAPVNANTANTHQGRDHAAVAIRHLANDPPQGAHHTLRLDLGPGQAHAVPLTPRPHHIQCGQSTAKRNMKRPTDPEPNLYRIITI